MSVGVDCCVTRVLSLLLFWEIFLSAIGLFHNQEGCQIQIPIPEEQQGEETTFSAVTYIYEHGGLDNLSTRFCYGAIVHGAQWYNSNMHASHIELQKNVYDMTLVVFVQDVCWKTGNGFFICSNNVDALIWMWQKQSLITRLPAKLLIIFAWMKQRCRVAVGFFLQAWPMLTMGTKEIISTSRPQRHLILSIWMMPRWITAVVLFLQAQLMQNSWMIVIYLVAIQLLILIVIQIQHGVKLKNYHNVLRLSILSKVIICTTVLISLVLQQIMMIWLESQVTSSTPLHYPHHHFELHLGVVHLELLHFFFYLFGWSFFRPLFCKGGW